MSVSRMANDFFLRENSVTDTSFSVIVHRPLSIIIYLLFVASRFLFPLMLHGERIRERFSNIRIFYYFHVKCHCIFIIRYSLTFERERERENL